MQRSYKYRLYPNKEQEHKLFQTLGSCRFTYNKLLETLNNARENDDKLSQTDTQAMLVDMKDKYPFLKEVNAKALQMVNYTLWSNIKALGRLKKNGKKVGKLRYKGRGFYKTINYNQSGFKFLDGKLRLSKIGDIRIKMHRPIDGKAKGVFIKNQCGKWYAIAQVDIDKKPMDPTGREVGIDLGIDSFAVDTNENSFEHLTNIEHTIDAIKRVQKDLSRKKKGSDNRNKVRKRLERMHEKLCNQRNDYLHKLSRYYIDNYDRIVVEDLDIKGMLEEKDKYKATLHRHIQESSWGRFVQMLEYKAESAGRTVIRIDPKGTTQKCSKCKCDAIVEKKLWHRTHKCPYCGFVADRDYNASVNILNSGSGRPVGPVENVSLSRIGANAVITGQIYSMKQEAPSSALGDT